MEPGSWQRCKRIKEHRNWSRENTAASSDVHWSATMTPRCYSMHWSIDRSSTSRHSDGPPEGRDGTSRALLIGLSLLFLGSSLGTGLFISTISTTERQAMPISVFLL